MMEDFFPRGLRIPTRNVHSAEERVHTRAPDAIHDVVEARMLVGVHFRSANEHGAVIGREIARLVRSRYFRSVPASRTL